MAKVHLQNVYKIYSGGVTAVSDVSLSIRHGEMLVLVGPSGCGKSTTLRMVAGLEDISRGAIHIGDRLVNDVPPKDRDIAMVFQNYALYPHMTVYENMAFGLTLRHFPKAEIQRRVAEAARILGLEDYLERRPKALSGGQRQRVAMGRAIVREPAVFLFDEPLSNLDAKMRGEMRKEILQLHQRLATTMIYVTHDQVEAMTLGDRICVMREGRIEQTGTPAEVFDHPASLFVARFIGTPPMNIFEGVLVQRGAGILFESEAVALPVAASCHEAVRPLIGKQACLGLRPRAFRLKQSGRQDPAISGKVDIAEMLGEEVLVHLSAGPHKFIVSVNSHEAPRPGAVIEVVPDIARAHVFDPATGRTLTAGAAGRGPSAASA